ncbi:hypothetical protein DFH06DRAFT_1297859 [Mycena polygramma]|nr:hypothetical protein DFH06DRAFT_1297859 [Mycena polygramma]
MLRVNPLHRKHLHQIHARPTEFMQQKTVETRTTHCRDGEKKTRQRMVPPILLVIQFQWCSARSTRVGSCQNGKGPRHFSSVPASTLFETGSGFLELIDHRVSPLPKGNLCSLVSSALRSHGRRRPDSEWFRSYSWRASPMKEIGSPFDSGSGYLSMYAGQREFVQHRIAGAPGMVSASTSFRTNACRAQDRAQQTQ